MTKLLESDIKNERFILVSENIHYKTLIHSIAENLGVNPPKKEAKPWLLSIAWRLDWIQHKVFGKRRVLVKQMVASLFNQAKYDNNKIKTALNYDFMPLEKSIENVTSQFLKEHT